MAFMSSSRSTTTRLSRWTARFSSRSLLAKVSRLRCQPSTSGWMARRARPWFGQIVGILQRALLAERWFDTR
ncbi:hypothetical protein BDW68DRAFT_172696 [Aspergillus falconensis]